MNYHIMEFKSPRSCDTFVCLPVNTLGNVMIFGKNSDRPSTEVQEIVYYPAKTYNPSESLTLKCTYIEIDQVSETAAVILSKPSWMWGAEMGANSFGVVIGNEAIFTSKVPDPIEKRLLGMDLLRLGLERSHSALEAVEVITNLLEKYGQGGPCSDTDPDFVYHNSYLIADPKEAWVLETVGNNWAAERVDVSPGYRNISNELSIGTKIDLKSKGLEDVGMSLGSKQSPIHFSDVFGDGSGGTRFRNGRKLLASLTESNTFDVASMMQILRDERSGINLGGYGRGGCSTNSSQVSIMCASSGFSCHLFTGTPNPKYSLFKPFVFGSTNSPDVTCLTTSPTIESDMNSLNFDYGHPLYKLHQSVYKRKTASLIEQISAIELPIIKEIDEKVRKAIHPSAIHQSGLCFSEAASAEAKLYSSILSS